MQKRLVKKGASWFLRLVVLLLLIVIAFFSFALFEESYKKKQVADEIAKLQDEAKRIEKENSQIREKIAYFESRDFQEKEARDKLNLQGEGENLVVVKPSLSKADSRQSDFPENKKPGEEQPNRKNYEKWWDYFFKY